MQNQGWFLERGASFIDPRESTTLRTLMFMRLKEMRIYIIFQDWSDVDEYEYVVGF